MIMMGVSIRHNGSRKRNSLNVNCVYLRNEFHFSGVHGAMNRSGSRAK